MQRAILALRWPLGSLRTDNRLFAQVAVNRVWTEPMGRGIVEPVDDLRATNPPSNAPLIEALAREFQHAALRFEKVAPDHHDVLCLWPVELAERGQPGRHAQLLAPLSPAVAGRNAAGCRAATLRACPNRSPQCPTASRSTQLWTHRVDSLFLDAFGRPDRNQDPPCERTPDTTMVQALHLMNVPNLHLKVIADKSVRGAAGRQRQKAAGDRRGVVPADLFAFSHGRRTIGRRAAVWHVGSRATPNDRRSAVGFAEYSGIRFQRLTQGSIQMALHRNCEGATRRDCLQLGLGAALAGGGLVNLLRMSGQAAEQRDQVLCRPTSCILVWMDGGPSHFETFDPKPDAPAKSAATSTPIATKIPGVYFSEHMERLAAISDKLCIVRSICHNQGEPRRGQPLHDDRCAAAHSGRLRLVCQLSSEPRLGGGLRTEGPARTAGVFFDPLHVALRRTEFFRGEIRPVRCRRRSQRQRFPRSRRSIAGRPDRRSLHWSPRSARAGRPLATVGR